MHKNGFTVTLVVGLLSASLASSASAMPVTYDATSQIMIYSKAKLTREERGKLREFKSGGDYFGAMYVNTLAGFVFWVKNYHTMQSALQVGEGGCKLLSPEYPGECTLYATLTPKGFSGLSSDKDGLGAAARKFYMKEFSSNPPKGKFGAFAISGMDNFGSSWGRASKEDATGAAIEFCKSSVSDELARFSEKMRNEIREAGLEKCRILRVVGD